jgi:drug/metabolite transporter (DMT)-like permease
VRRFYIIGFIVLLVFDTFSQVCFKLAANHIQPPENLEAVLNIMWVMKVVTEPWAYGAALGYLGSFITWMTLLKHAPIGPAFAATHLEIVTVAIISVLYLHESLTLLQVVGSVLIVSGILVLAAGTSHEGEPALEIASRGPVPDE